CRAQSLPGRAIGTAMLADHYGLKDREMREQANVLERACDPAGGAARRPALVERAAFEHDPAFVGAKHPGEQIEECGLSGTVWSDQRMNVPGRDLHIEFVEGEKSAEPLRQTFDLETGGGRLRHGAASTGGAANRA